MVVLAAAAAAWAQDSSSGRSDRRPTPSVQPADDLTPSLLDRSTPPIIRPRGHREPNAPTTRLDRENLLIDRRCRIEKIKAVNWYMLRFLPEPNQPAISARLLLPSRRLEEIEPFAAMQPRPILKVTGETTTYRGKQFFMLMDVVIDSRQTEAPVPASQPAMVIAPSAATPSNDSDGNMAIVDASPAKDANAAAPQTATSPAPASAPDSDDILGVLAVDTPGRRIVVPVAEHAKPGEIKEGHKLEDLTAQATQPADDALTSGNGNNVVDRVVRILPETKEGWFTVNFEGDNTLREPPMRLLPCSWLEKAEAMVKGAGAATIKFRVSGEITEYKGQRYLLVRKLLQEHEMGQLK